MMRMMMMMMMMTMFQDGKVVDTSRFPPCGLRNGPPSCQDGSNLKCADGAEIKRPKVMMMMMIMMMMMMMMVMIGL